MVGEWQRDCSLLVMSKISVTIKVYTRLCVISVKLRYTLVLVKSVKQLRFKKLFYTSVNKFDLMISVYINLSIHVDVLTIRVTSSCFYLNLA